MHPWLIFLQTFPIVAVLLFLVVGRRPPWQAALAGVFVALVLWLTGTAQPYAAQALPP